jgi:hypothetical protein
MKKSLEKTDKYWKNVIGTFIFIFLWVVKWVVVQSMGLYIHPEANVMISYLLQLFLLIFGEKIGVFLKNPT